MIKKFLPAFCLASFVVSSCDQPAMMTAASCPSSPVNVMKVMYQEAQGDYLVFHTESNGQKQLANPLHIANLQMLQIPKISGSDSDFARMNFKFKEGKCNPILEMTQGFKIELQQSSGSSQTAQNGSSSGSYWAPFLMGAVAGHLLSGSHAAPAYYLPPPAGSQHVNQNGVVTGGVSAKSSDELNKKYESEYKQSNAKKGFFSRSNSSAQAPTETKKTGFFSNGSSSKRSSGGFFRKR